MSSARRRATLALAMLLSLSAALVACTHGARRVEFQGLAADPRVSAAAVAEVPVLPRGADRLGRLSVRCEPVDASESFTERSLVDVDCSEARLRAMLREAAAERGGDVLAELDCSQSGGLRCRATLGRRPDPAPTLGRSTESRPPAPSQAEFAASTRAEPAAPIWVSFALKSPTRTHSARERTAVRELTHANPTAMSVGELTTCCEGCQERDLREALLLSAARLGIADVVGVQCSADAASRRRCQADATVPELENDDRRSGL